MQRNHSLSKMADLLIRYLRRFKMEKILPMLKYHPNYRIQNRCMRDKLFDWHNHAMKEKEMIARGFNSAGILEAVQNAEDIYEKIENPFRK